MKIWALNGLNAKTVKAIVASKPRSPDLYTYDCESNRLNIITRSNLPYCI